jgi:hypothetical protein
MKEISLSRDKVALIDDEDFEFLSSIHWYATALNYAKARLRNQDGKLYSVLMHRLLLGARKGEQVDHKNHDTLDNRRVNLRLCSNAENTKNRRKHKNSSSLYKGVSWFPYTRKWRAQICFNGKVISLGYFLSEQEAALVYKEKAKELFGEFAYYEIS